jgi:hypothetical protein
MSLREDTFQTAYETLAGEYDEDDRHQLEKFRKHLAWCGDKVYAASANWGAIISYYFYFPLLYVLIHY